MIYSAKVEYRGYEERVSSKGNKYKNIYVEDNASGKQEQLFVANSTLDLSQFKKGDQVKIECAREYRYGAYHFELVNIYK